MNTKKNRSTVVVAILTVLVSVVVTFGFWELMVYIMKHL